MNLLLQIYFLLISSLTESTAKNPTLVIGSCGGSIQELCLQSVNFLPIPKVIGGKDGEYPPWLKGLLIEVESLPNKAGKLVVSQRDSEKRIYTRTFKASHIVGSSGATVTYDVPLKSKNYLTQEQIETFLAIKDPKEVIAKAPAFFAGLDIRIMIDQTP